MAAKTLPTVDELRQLLRADFNSGTLVWRPRPPEMFAHTGHPPSQAARWNKRMAGRPALNAVSSTGYRFGTIWNGITYAHRVLWAMAHGEWPDGEIDHINADKLDNRIENLRVVSKRENARNRRLSKRNKSGITGVCWCRKRRAWVASIKGDTGTINLGRFKCVGMAMRARKQAQRQLGYHPNHGKAV